MNDSINEKLTIGLTGTKVLEMINGGLVNGDGDVKTKSYGQIIRDNALSFFNLINTILLVCILFSGSLKNALFYGVVLWNFGIGVFQEIRAKKTIEKLSLISAQKTDVLRDGIIEPVYSKDIVLGEICHLKSGNQVCCDSVVLKGACQVNESLVTGESDPIEKKAGDKLVSGSFLVSGNVWAEVYHVGDDNLVSKITKGAKYVKKSNSIIMNSVRKVVRIVAIALIPLAALMVWKNFFLINQAFSESMVATVASVSAMIPGGLVLLVSMIMAVSVIRLSMHQTLVQDLYSVEYLARVDVICMDKTGTLTEGNLKVEEIFQLDGYDKNDLIDFVSGMDDENSTIQAIRKHFDVSEYGGGENQVAFSSQTKYSALGSLMLGAPEIVAPGVEVQRVSEWAAQCKRVVAFARDGIPVAFIVVGDSVRENARATLDYFNSQNVDVKIISGDNPVTVSKIAAQAGLRDADRFVDAMTLADEDIPDAVCRYTVFGRVSPYQKLEIIKALKAQGHSVAMVGDGANDVLALKEADCSVAMQSGSDAAKNVSSVVLLDSDFAHMPMIVEEGRKTINNLQRSAGLYLTKTTYAFILTIAFLFLPFAYPFQNIQITLIGMVTIGIPSFLLALEPNKSRADEHFLKNVFKMAVPSGVLTVAAVLAAVFAAKNALGAATNQVQTVATFTAILVGIIVVFDIAGRMNKWKWLLLACITVVAAVCIIVVPKLFGIVKLSESMWLTVGICAVGFFAVHAFIFRVLPVLSKHCKKGHFGIK